MDLKTIHCAHGKPVTEHCLECMESYFRVICLPIDEAAYLAMRAKALSQSAIARAEALDKVSARKGAVPDAAPYGLLGEPFSDSASTNETISNKRGD